MKPRDEVPPDEVDYLVRLTIRTMRGNLLHQVKIAKRLRGLGWGVVFARQEYRQKEAELLTVCEAVTRACQEPQRDAMAATPSGGLLDRISRPAPISPPPLKRASDPKPPHVLEIDQLIDVTTYELEQSELATKGELTDRVQSQSRALDPKRRADDYEAKEASLRALCLRVLDEIRIHEKKRRPEECFRLRWESVVD